MALANDLSSVKILKLGEVKSSWRPCGLDGELLVAEVTVSRTRTLSSELPPGGVEGDFGVFKPLSNFSHRRGKRPPVFNILLFRWAL